MFRIKPVLMPSLWEAILLTLITIAIMFSSIVIFGTDPHIPLAIVLLLLMMYGLSKKVSYKQLEEGITEGAKAGMAAVFLFFFIGILIAAWMFAGTIPTLIYAGFNLVTPQFYLAVVFVVCAIVGISVGSSLTTVGTVGVAFIGISSAIDVSLPMTAGAIVSGAFFGDKMSPLSDTTNMASSILHVDLFAHIKNMGWTTFPAFFISLVLFAFISPSMQHADFSGIETFKLGLLVTWLIIFVCVIMLVYLFAHIKNMGWTTFPAFFISLVLFAFISPSMQHADFSGIETFKLGLLDTGLISWDRAIIPIVILVVFSIKKAPALLALAA